MNTGGGYTRSALFSPPNDQKLTAAEQKRKTKQKKKKKKKIRWKDRITPTPKVEEKEDVIDEEILTRCTRCPTHRNRTGHFRPLIGNGEYLCDACYMTEFPATAMLDDTTNINNSALRRASVKVANVLRNKITDSAADVMGISAATPGANTTKASVRNDNNNSVDSYPSEVECRMCLERGMLRQCCSSYYCHSCYYQAAQCPSCKAPAPLTGIAAADKPDPGKLGVGISWAISILLVILTIVMCLLLYINASTTPTTVWGHSCRGWFEKCNLSVCIDYDSGDAAYYGQSGDFLPAAQMYKVCDRDSSSNMVVGSACVYDKELYAWSDNLLGYDLCVSSPREENARPNHVSDLDPLLLYSESYSGVYVFDDDFEDPTRNASAPWVEIINGYQSTECGVNNQPPERGFHHGYQSIDNKQALVFTGVQTRHAITSDLDLTYGGRVEFYLKMGSLTGNTECKAAFSDVILEYRTNVNSEWTVFGSYAAYLYRDTKEFKFVSETIPQDGWSASTQIRFKQPSFDVLRDHWAIDDVRVFALLKPQWEGSSEIKHRQDEQNTDVLFAQCCYNTEQCSVYDKKKIDFNEQQCQDILNFDLSKRSHSRLKVSDLLIFYCCLAIMAKKVLALVAERFITRRNKAEEEANDSEQVKDDSDLFPRKSFYSKTQSSWQYTIVSVFVTAFACTLYRLLGALIELRRQRETL